MVNETELNTSLYRPQDFKIEKGVKMLNCGSYGVIPTSVHASRVAWLEKIDSHSDTWICDKRVELLEESITPLAEYIGAPAKDTVFVSNTTQGFVHILETMGLGPGDLIVYNSSTYGAIQMLVEQLRENKGIELLKLDYNAEDDDSLIKYYKTEFDNLAKLGKLQN
ncbi:hypothetical protein CONCODRAFT_73651 [Conidiobolus coronatus NRRL 28638]|uniref:Aminotransferase class V domain-containing protein n=1 Tax=Conidiobolus coronatus (strain ATCC 28846 / CBS 209.66 / NRRL 28638) TaxID=796925 RepID=A0A137NV59_CONC2|nr:hypothetical protein CONCODRAFT_73651 [Conidiobolus coronatus NRRL 28638]|eukprot:KXN66494.1 hypothetical protein CONCODRAFT_73651 [Conidiobolus coronatus NRRL 28638]